MKLRNDYIEVINRHQKLYDSTKGALIYTGIREAYIGKKKIDYTKFNLPNDYTKVLDLMSENVINYWNNRKNVLDDCLPHIRPRYGLMEHSAFITLNNEPPIVEVFENTSYHHEILKDLSDIQNLKFNEDSLYYKMTIDGIKYLKEKLAGICFVAERGVNSPLDLANSLRGNDLFLDCLIDVDNTNLLLDYCLDIDIKYAFKQMEVTPKYEGGYVSGFGVWLPGDSFGHLADDASVIMGPNTYQDIGLQHSIKLASHFDKVYFHSHTTGHYALPIISKIPNILVLEISNDPNEMRGIEVFKMYENDIKKFVVSLEITFEELKENVGFLADKRVILNIDAKTCDKANEIVEFVRKNLPIE